MKILGGEGGGAPPPRHPLNPPVASVDPNPVTSFTLKQTSKNTSLMMSSSADFSVGSSQAFGYDNNGHRPKTSTPSSAEHTATDRYRIEKAG